MLLTESPPTDVFLLCHHPLNGSKVFFENLQFMFFEASKQFVHISDQQKTFTFVDLEQSLGPVTNSSEQSRFCLKVN